MDDIATLITRAEFPLASRYDRDWVLENQMGPNALWLCEWLCQAMPLQAGMRVLDLGCGRAMTSIFLARELGVQVWAADLWMSPDNNWKRIVKAGVAERVCPMKAEAHALPFAQGFFDAVVSIDGYQYFGTDQLYLGYLSGFIRPGGLIGIAVPALMRDFGDQVPEHLASPQSNGKVFWEDECWCFKTAAWWEESWRRCGKVADVKVDALNDGWRLWRDWERALELSGKSSFPSDAEALDRDQGRTMGFVRATARRTEAVGTNHYDPALGVVVGVDS